MDHLRDHIQVDVAGDGLRASISSTHPFPGRSVRVQHIVALLKERGVRFGVDEGQIRTFLERWPRGEGDEPCAVARGAPPVPGYVAQLQRIAPRARSGRNLVELLPLFVEEGEPFIRVLPERPGKSGISVRGESLPAPEISREPIRAGEGIVVEGDKWVATRAGFLEHADGEIVVSTCLLHLHDLAAGEYRWHGDAVISGTLLPGVRLTLDGSVQVEGSVEDNVSLTAGGDITVEGDVTGGATKLSAEGSATVATVNGSSIQARGEIRVRRLCRDAHCRTYGQFLAETEGSQVFGGRIEAVQGAHLFEVGSTEGIPTLVIVGSGEWVHEETRRLDHDLKVWRRHYQQSYDAFEKRFAHLLTDRAEIYRLSAADRATYEQARTSLEEEEKRVEKMIATTRTRQLNLSEARARVEAAVVRLVHAHTGCTFVIRRRKYRVGDTPLSNVALTLAPRRNRVLAVPKFIYDSSRADALVDDTDDKVSEATA